jgi:phytoene dehydrogenase-like protein
MSYGAEIRTEAAVKQVLIKGGVATGVVLENGDEILAQTVISNLDPNRTYLKMVGEANLDPEVTRQIKRFKLRGSSGKVNLALDSVPEFSCRPGDGDHIRGDIAIAPGTDYLERAYDQAKYGEFSSRPYINAVIPTLTDPSLAPPGKHIMSCFVQYAPYHIKEGAENWPKYREAFGDAVVDTLAEYIPGLRDKILYRQVLTPWDLEQSMGLTEGNIFQGELSLEQLLFQRPLADFSKYKTSVPKLWMCGSGTHPGGGIMGASGELCAKTMLTSRAL